jgi:probable phosphoglycerate mutase
VRLPPNLHATLVLVRHGESTYIAEGRFQGRHDAPLSPLGERQAQLVAARLAQRDAETPLPIPAGVPSAIWHSPLSRAAETARAIAEAQPAAVPLRPAPGLIEIAQGEWEGQPQAVVHERWAAELAAWRRTPATNNAPGGEPISMAARRVTATLDDVFAELGALIGASADGDILSRSFVPGYSVAGADGQPQDPWAVLVAHDGIFRLTLLSLLDLPLERFWSFPFNLCGITVVAVQNGVAVLRAHNLSEHLAPIADEARAAAEARGDRPGAL